MFCCRPTWNIARRLRAGSRWVTPASGCPSRKRSALPGQRCASWR
jgi:hypothetical protein